MKRTAIWKWEDDDWGVVIKLSKDEKPERVGMALPRLTPESKSTLSESLLQRGLQKVGSVDLPGSPTRSRHDGQVLAGGEGMGTFSDLQDVGDGHGSGGHSKEGSGVGDVPKAVEEDDVTDAEGWTYGDNKWEGGSGKGGIGKVSASTYQLETKSSYLFVHSILAIDDGLVWQSSLKQLKLSHHPKTQHQIRLLQYQLLVPRRSRPHHHPSPGRPLPSPINHNQSLRAS